MHSSSRNRTGYSSQVPSEYDFTKIVLNWTWDDISQPLIEAQEQSPLPLVADNLDEYYDNFKPFVIEEARATIQDSLLKIRQSQPKAKKKNCQKSLPVEAKPFNLQLLRNAKLPRNEGNPLGLSFKGVIPKKIEHGFAMNVLMLYSQDSRFSIRWLGLASEKPEQEQTYVKIISTTDAFYNAQECFQKDHRWKAYYLGSVISEQRIYDACMSAVNLPCLKNISQAELDFSPSFSNITFSGLNLSQSRAIKSFLQAPKHSTTLLQGPPGTGKTTTVARLLKELDRSNKRTLVSAHSNKGVQVLAEKTMHLLPDVPMILIGVEKKIPENLKHLSLNSWYGIIEDAFLFMVDAVNKILNEVTKKNFRWKNLTDTVKKLKEKTVFIEQQLARFNFLHKNRSSYSFCSSDVFQELYGLLEGNHLGSFITSIEILLDSWRSEKKSDIELHLLDTATIIFATLVSCGRRCVLQMEPVDVLLIDEAAQSVEAATLIPMQCEPNKILLVGDPQQLPGTVISKLLNPSHGQSHRQSKHYEWSMMWRLIKECRLPHLMLTTQYRMHPWICQWPSAQYYDGRLVTGPDILPMKPLSQHGLASEPYAFYNISGKAEVEKNSSSVFNKKEAEYVVKVVRHLRNSGVKESIGIITPYVAQKHLILIRLSQLKLSDKVDVNTVDAFQGDERPIMILSLVRSHVTAFLEDFRRLNVAITRAKHCLIMLGNANKLVTHDIGNLIEDARLRHQLYSEDDLLNRLSNKSSILNEPNKQLEIARSLLNGVGRKQNMKAARQQFLGLSRKGDQQAQYYFAMMCQTGIGGEKNIELALKWYAEAAKQAHTESLYQLSGLLLLRQKNYQSRQYLQRAAEQQHPEAQYRLGCLYLSKKRNSDRNPQLGLKWLLLATEQRHGPAAFMVAKYYKNHASDYVDPKKAIFYFFKLAAEEGHSDAYFELSICYQTGYGVKANASQAFSYLKLAAENNNAKSQFQLATLFYNGSKNIQSNVSEAIKWYHLAANADHAPAYYPLACALYSQESYASAVKWYKKSSENNNVLADFILARCYRDGIGVKKDRIQMIKHFKVVVNSGHKEAQMEFADWLIVNDYHDRDDDTIMFFLKLAADQPTAHTAACFWYGFHQYRQGSYSVAIHYFECSSSLFTTGDRLYCFAHAVEKSHSFNLEKYFSLYLAAAQLGHIYSMAKVVNLLDTHEQLNIHLSDIKNILEIAALDKNCMATYFLAMILEKGQDEWRDVSRAEQLYQSIESVYYFAKYRLACLLIKKNSEYEKIIALLQEYTIQYKENLLPSHLSQATVPTFSNKSNFAVAYIDHPLNIELEDRKNYIDAEYRLGYFHEKGLGVQRNVLKARDHYKLAAEEKHPASLYAIGLLCEIGDLGEHNRSRAQGFYQKAAELGHPLAAKRISFSYTLSRRLQGLLSSNQAPSDDDLNQPDKKCLVM